jgi:hypothetical protein
MGNYDNYMLDDESSLTDQEKWVLEQVGKGLFADLKEQFGEKEEDRGLRANFLEKLLSDGFYEFKVNPRGIILKNVIIFQALNLGNYEIKHNVTWDSCIFLESANFKGTVFKRSLSLNSTEFLKLVDFTSACIGDELDATGAKFKNKEKPANFNSLKVGRHAAFVDAQFQGPVDFIAARIGEQFNATGANFESKDNLANFNSIEIGQHAIFINAQFQGPVDFSAAHVKGEFDATATKFKNKDKGASFNSLRVREHANFSNAVFRGLVDFQDADITEKFTANDAKFLGAKYPARFNGLKVKHGFFINARFHGPVDFIGASLTGYYVAINAKFLNSKQTANFDSMVVGRNALYQGSIFQGPVDFTMANINGVFDVSGAQFKSESQTVNFTGMKVSQNAIFRNAVFWGPVDFLMVDIGGQFNATEAGFGNGENKEKKFNFNSMKVGQSAKFNDVVFQGEVEFIAANIVGQFDVRGAQFANKVSFESLKVGQHAIFRNSKFNGKTDFSFVDVRGSLDFRSIQDEKQKIKPTIFEKQTMFTGLKVGHHALYQGTIFQGPVDFVAMNIGGQFNAVGAMFKNEENDNGKVNFNSMKTGQHAHFQNAIFQRETEFIAANIGGYLIADGTQFESDKPANFESMKVGQNALFQKSIFKGSVNFSSARIEGEFKISQTECNFLLASNFQVKGATTFEKVIITEHADLRDATFQPLYLIEVKWPQNKNQLWLDGLTYTALSTRADPLVKEDWGKLLEWIDNSRFNAQNYSQLEAYFFRCGYKDRANKVFVAGKRREWLKTWSWNILKWPGDILKLLLWDLGVRYGRSPIRSLYYSILFVLFGAWVFSRPGILKCGNEVINPVWYSLDLFLPFVSLGPDKSCQIQQNAHVSLPNWLITYLPDIIGDYYLSAQTYSYIHQFMGYILISIGLAAVISLAGSK